MVRVQTQDFSVETEIQSLRRKAGQSGALASFVGIVRGAATDKTIRAMTLEHYPGMTEAALREIARQAHARWRLDAETIIHRVGELHPGEQIVLAATAAPHRQDAFAALQFIMDHLKTDAPFWKKEHTDSGAHWVQSRASDTVAKARWR